MNSLRTERILVTGAGGFIGRNLVKFLSGIGRQVVAATRHPDQVDLPCQIRTMPDLLASHSKFASLLSGVDIVIHAAGLAHESPNDHRHDAINRLGTQMLVDSARQLDVKHFVFISSVAAQSGPSRSEVLTEDDPPEPHSLYGHSKLAAERIIRQSGLNYTILRPVAVYGPGAKGSMAALERIAGSPFPLPIASLSRQRSVLSIMNLCSAVSLIAGNRAAYRKVLLVADPQPVSIAEMVRRMRSSKGRHECLIAFPPSLLKILFVALGKPNWSRSLDSSLIVSVAALKSLGWSPDCMCTDEATDFT